jgi:branched-chain amino acid aminotransferase
MGQRRAQISDEAARMGDPSRVWLNGRLLPEDEASLSIFDRGFTLGDGIFETLRVRDGRPLWLGDHLARLRQGADVFGIPVPFGDAAIRRGLAELIEASGQPQASLRLTMSRGPSRARGLWPPASPATPTLLAIVSPFPGAARPPLRLIVANTVRRNEHSPLSLIKSLNYGDNILARREAESRGADDALMMNSQGRITCGTVGNIFLRFAGEWITPPIADGILAGTARRRLIPMLGAREHAIDRADLQRAEAGMVSNSLSLTAIGTLNGRALEDASSVAEDLSLFENERPAL